MSVEGKLILLPGQAQLQLSAELLLGQKDYYNWRITVNAKLIKEISFCSDPPYTHTHTLCRGSTYVLLSCYKTEPALMVVGVCSQVKPMVTALQLIGAAWLSGFPGEPEEEVVAILNSLHTHFRRQRYTDTPCASETRAFGKTDPPGTWSFRSVRRCCHEQFAAVGTEAAALVLWELGLQAGRQQGCGGWLSAGLFCGASRGPLAQGRSPKRVGGFPWPVGRRPVWVKQGPGGNPSPTSGAWPEG